MHSDCQSRQYANHFKRIDTIHSGRCELFHSKYQSVKVLLTDAGACDNVATVARGSSPSQVVALPRIKGWRMSNA